MNEILQTTIAKAVDGHRGAIIALLQSEHLPADDLPAALDHFFVAMDSEKVIGAVGLEVYDNCGLLRSMVVNKPYRNRQLAAQLVQILEEYAKQKDVHTLYLLTETAADYFSRKGYHVVKREEVPGALQASPEFSHVCPVSAIAMKKELQ